MLEHLKRLPADPILGLMTAFRADTDPLKVDLGVGVYQDESGETPIMQTVRQAEQELLVSETTKTYVAASGNAGFNDAMARLVLGADHPALCAGRLRTIQAPGGSGALRLGAALVREACAEAAIYVSSPTWANHPPLLTSCGTRLERYPYFDAVTGGVAFEAMLAALEHVPPRSVVLLHASCHNPTGADLTEDEWRKLLAQLKRRSLLPFIDIAYQGFGAGLEQDVFAPRLFCSELPEALIAVSCSKNFGLYRERTGCLHVLGESPAAAEAALTQLVRIARGLYSTSPDHGAAVVHRILASERLRGSWQRELEEMRSRIGRLREQVVRALRETCPHTDFSYILRQRGMFSHLGIEVREARELRERHHIYMLEDGRINIAGLRSANLGYFAQAIAKVCGSR